jgi:hypothetical protein
MARGKVHKSIGSLADFWENLRSGPGFRDWLALWNFAKWPGVSVV